MKLIVVAADVKWDGHRYFRGETFDVVGERKQKQADTLVKVGKVAIVPVRPARPVGHAATVTPRPAPVVEPEPAPEPIPEPVAETTAEPEPADLSHMTRRALLALAAERGVEVETDDNKADLIRKLS